MRRAIKLNFNDGTSKELELSKATLVKTKKEMLSLDMLDDGTWRLIWSENLIADFTKLVNMEVVRED